MQKWRAWLVRIAPAFLSLGQTTDATNTIILSIEPRTILWIAVGVVLGWMLYKLGKAIID